MSKTGYLITVYQDCNPYSETYGQERTERELDTAMCEVQQSANYVLVYTYCEMNAVGAYTGNCVSVYEDVEPLSATYGQQMEQLSTDQVLCPPDSAEPVWEQVGDGFCEQITYMPSGRTGNSGYFITEYVNTNEFSPTYNSVRTERVIDYAHCPPPTTQDTWLIISETCHLENGVQDGTKDVVRVETNEFSPNYNDGIPETINVPDAVMCPADPAAPVWTETSYVCEQSDGYNTGYTIITEEDTNSQSSTYGQTRTRRVSDDVRCPAQTADIIRWRVINNRSVSTDTITSITLNFNTNAFTITASGVLASGGGQISGSSILPASLKSTALSCTSVTLSPNASLPTLFQYSQTPSTYTWDDDHASTLVITLWDGDGAGPEWEEVSYTCETVSGYRTGAAIIIEEDMNPNSATYGQQRTRVFENDIRCPAQTGADWVETSWSCEKINGYNTGNRLSVQTDQNPNSPTYGSTRTRIIADSVNCPTSTNPDWVAVSYTCEQVNDGDEYRHFKYQWWRRIDNVTTYGQIDCDDVNDEPHICTTKMLCGDCMTASIPDDYLKDNTSIAYIDLWENTTSIGNRAFYGCGSLRTVILRNTVPPTLGTSVFEDANSSLKIYVPDSSVTAYQTAWTAYASKIEPISNLT